MAMLFNSGETPVAWIIFRRFGQWVQMSCSGGTVSNERRAFDKSQE